MQSRPGAWTVQGIAAGVLVWAAGICSAGAEPITPVPKLDLKQVTGAWYEVVRLPNKRQKHCAEDVIELVALGDKAKTLQIVDSCTTKNGYNDVANEMVKQSKAGDGKLQSGYFPFRRKLWVIGLAPDDSWVVLGSPNHKELRILSRSSSLDSTELSTLEANAAAQGFRTNKLAATTQDEK